MDPVQNGCKKNSQGCKELLTIDNIVVKPAVKSQRNLHMAYINFKKAYNRPSFMLFKYLVANFGERSHNFGSGMNPIFERQSVAFPHTYLLDENKPNFTQLFMKILLSDPIPDRV